MKTATVSEFRENIKEFLEEVFEDHEELIISRPKNKSVVVLSLEDYESMRETAYLLSSSANAKRIHESLEQYKKGRVSKRAVKDL